MMKVIKKIIIILSIITSYISCSNNEETPIELNLPPEPEIVIPIENTLGVIKKSEGAYDGFTLFTSNKNTFLINNCGQVINHWVSNYERGGGVYLLDDGSILRNGKIDNPDILIGGIGGIIERFDWNGTMTWSFKYSSSIYSQHHDLYPLPNGNILLLAAESKTKEEAVLEGRNPDLLENDEIYTEQVIEIIPNGTNGGTIVWKWDIWNHLIQDYDSSKLNYGNINENPQLLDINFVTVDGVAKKDWLHFNSMQYNQELDQILLSSQALSEIYIIDHSTSNEESASHSGGKNNKGGDFLYRWGNQLVYKSGSKTDQKLFGPHFPNWITYGEDKGKILIFNNGLGRSENFSSVDIINLPIDSNGNYQTPSNDQGFLPENPYWIYTNSIDPLNFYSRNISSAQRLPNGNTLICEGAKGHFFEINANREVSNYAV